MRPRVLLDPEVWLRSIPRRALLVLSLVLIAAAVTTSQQIDLVAAWGRGELDRGQLFLEQLLLWSVWGLLGPLIVWIARWLLRSTGNWVLLLLIQLPLSWGVSLAVVELNTEISQAVSGRESYPYRWSGGRRGGRGERGGVPPREGLPPPEDQDPEELERRSEERAVQFRERMIAMRQPRELFVYWVVLLLGAGAHAFLEGRSRERETQELSLRTANLQAELALAQVDSLRAQLHPHFLFNALHTVGGLIRAGQAETALKTLSALGGLLRTTLEQGAAHEVCLREELDVARLYLDIERIRFGERLRHELDAAPDCLGARVPALLLLPLVENAVRYGVEPRPEGGRVAVTARREGALLVLEVRDDGPGFPAEVLAGGPSRSGNGDHIGLANDRQRLSVLYGDQHRFELSNPEGGGARVRIELPFAEAGAED